jgi:hypothetical protein
MWPLPTRRLSQGQNMTFVIRTSSRLHSTPRPASRSQCFTDVVHSALSLSFQFGILWLGAQVTSRVHGRDLLQPQARKRCARVPAYPRYPGTRRSPARNLIDLDDLRSSSRNVFWAMGGQAKFARILRVCLAWRPALTLTVSEDYYPLATALTQSTE